MEPTREGWVRVPQLPADPGPLICADRFPLFSNGAWGYNLGINGGGNVTFDYYSNVGIIEWAGSDFGAITVDTWHHIAGVVTDTEVQGGRVDR